MELLFKAPQRRILTVHAKISTKIYERHMKFTHAHLFFPERNDRPWEGFFKEGLHYAVVVEYEENMRTRYKYPIWRIERRLFETLTFWHHFGL